MFISLPWTIALVVTAGAASIVSLGAAAIAHLKKDEDVTPPDNE